MLMVTTIQQWRVQYAQRQHVTQAFVDVGLAQVRHILILSMLPHGCQRSAAVVPAPASEQH